MDHTNFAESIALQGQSSKNGIDATRKLFIVRTNSFKPSTTTGSRRQSRRQSDVGLQKVPAAWCWDASLPDATTLAQAVALQVREGKAVAIHCRAGIGRSSLIAAGVLICSA
jgi:ABC-type transport system involved in cytochrome bd biosynthesis fused ATPase/permease subunit